jgi:hypothetical protein
MKTGNQMWLEQLQISYAHRVKQGYRLGLNELLKEMIFTALEVRAEKKIK